MTRRIPTVLMRGGTSKALFFHENHLPKDPEQQQEVILSIYGSPDPYKRQIDGLGGGTSVTSKVAVISPSDHPDYDVVYHFGQVAIDRAMVDFKGNCGNISSAVGPFAVDAGLVKAVEPVTTVRIYQKNTDKLIIAHVPVKKGVFDHCGDFAISGVPGTHSKITLEFVDPAGSLTGKLFPTGSPVDIFDIPGHGRIPVTIIDAANPVVLVQAGSIGLAGTEIDVIDKNINIKTTLETIRCKAAVMIGLAADEKQASMESQAVPKMAFVSRSQSYISTGGTRINEDEIDLVARIMSMGTLHQSFAVSGAVAVAGAAMIPGTTAHQLVAPDVVKGRLVRIGHPSGVIDVGPVIDRKGTKPFYKSVFVFRTARRLMEGYVFVP